MNECLPNDHFVTGIRPYYREMVVQHSQSAYVEWLGLDFYRVSVTEDDVYGVVSYLWLNGRWMVESVNWRYDGRPRPVLMTFIRPLDWAKHEVLK